MLYKFNPHNPENWIWYACRNQTAITFDLYFQSLCHLDYFVAELIRIKMVPTVGFRPGAKPSGQNPCCKLTFGEETHKPFTYLYKMIHNSRTLAPIAPQ